MKAPMTKGRSTWRRYTRITPTATSAKVRRGRARTWRDEPVKTMSRELVLPFGREGVHRGEFPAEEVADAGTTAAAPELPPPFAAGRIFPALSLALGSRETRIFPDRDISLLAARVYPGISGLSAAAQILPSTVRRGSTLAGSCPSLPLAAPRRLGFTRSIAGLYKLYIAIPPGPRLYELYYIWPVLRYRLYLQLYRAARNRRVSTFKSRHLPTPLATENALTCLPPQRSALVVPPGCGCKPLVLFSG